MNYKLYFWVCFLFLGLSFTPLSAQKTILSLSSKEVLQTFSSSGTEFRWGFPIAENEQVTLLWRETKTSFSSQGIRTFVGYQNGEFKATATINSTEFSATLSLKHQEFRIVTHSDGRLVLEKNQHIGRCGNCQNGNCSASIPASIEFNSGISEAILPVRKFTTQQNKGFADAVLRVYRLALPITYEYFNTKFNNKISEVQSFWAQTETALNEIYMRDISVKFQVINNDKLIIQTSSDPINHASYNGEAEKIIQNATRNINQLIEESAYDIGLVLGKSADLRLLGLAGVGAAYVSYAKAQGISVPEIKTITHEIGHMFGAEHTHQYDDSVKTEVGDGQSAMSYGEPMNFFSLVSIGEHIKPLLSRIPYYSDTNKTAMVGVPFTKDGHRYDNAPYGINTNNKAPLLNKNIIQQEYIIPKETFFQFKFSAKDPEGKKMYYMANPADIVSVGNKTSNAEFLTYPASDNSTIAFQTEYEADLSKIRQYQTEALVEKPYSTPSKTGTYTFWLGVRDSDIEAGYTERQNHATMYDVAETKVKIIEGKPFKLTNSFKTKYKAGEKILLEWNNDTNIFPETTKVRILLSDDFGKTYKYVLKSSAENNGKCEIVLPNISIGTIDFTTEFSPTPLQIPAGIIKIEVIDHLAYDVSATRPFSIKRAIRGFDTKIMGGFLLETTGIQFKNTPEQEISVTCENIPEKANVTAVTHNCLPNQITIDFKEVGRENTCVAHTFKRVWTATDSCGNTADFEQIINVIPTLRFAGNLPTDTKVPCTNIPEAPQNLTTTGGCGKVKISYSETRENITCDAVSYIIRTWTATDSCHNEAQYVQVLTIEPQVVVYNAVSTESGSKNYFKVSNVPTGRIVIFDQMGLRVFESDNYGEAGDIFRGYSNVSSFNNQKVVAGTYFYIFIYTDANGITQQKKGFLYVK